MPPKKRKAESAAAAAAEPPKMSAYQAYMKAELARVKAANPSMNHDAAFRMVAAGWKQHPTNPKRAPTDWKTPLFYWRGAIDGDTWAGTWVASADGLPSDADFAASENTFTLKCSAELGKSMSSPATLAGSYKLDQGDGLADFSDISHEVYAIDGPPGHHGLGEQGAETDWAVVGATGNTEFGRFVSLGRLDGAESYDSGYSRLTLARRYLDDDDPRVGMSAKAVATRVAGCGPDEWALGAPWLALPWKILAVPEAAVPGAAPWTSRGQMPESAFKGCGKACLDNCETVGTAWAVGVAPALYGSLLENPF